MNRFSGVFHLGLSPTLSHTKELKTQKGDEDEEQVMSPGQTALCAPHTSLHFIPRQPWDIRAAISTSQMR